MDEVRVSENGAVLHPRRCHRYGLLPEGRDKVVAIR